ncbi:MAG: hypothetical protein H0U17_09710 [Actinobacteria bacterium]|nr:hypothetical protein [Actinomycetota bacterium]
MNLGDLMGHVGNQDNELPTDVDADDNRSLVIRFEGFAVGLAVAPRRVQTQGTGR